MYAFLISAAAAAPVTLVGALGAGADIERQGPLVGGAIRRNFSDRWALEVGVGEGLLGSDIVGDIDVLGRWSHPGGLTLASGLAHSHETPFDSARESPLDAMLGTHGDIRHRTGLGLHAGWQTLLGADTRWGVVTGAGLRMYTSGAPTLGLRLGVSFDVGRSSVVEA